MAISLFDYVVYKLGERERYSMADFSEAGVPMIGGCQRCAATIAGGGAYPSTTGYLQCADCIYDDGFDTVEAFDAWIAEDEEDELLDDPDFDSLDLKETSPDGA